LGVSARGLNTSLPSCLHPESIKRIFYPCPQRSLVLGWVSSLDAFSFYPVSRSRSALPCRTTDQPVATTESSSRTISILPSDSEHS